MYLAWERDVVRDDNMPPGLHYGASEDLLARSVDCIKQWLSKCDSDHQECKLSAHSRANSSKSHQLPTRLLQLMQEKRSLEVCLCNTKDLPLETRYATLSHCWGTSQSIKLLSENYNQFKHSIDFSSLPRTFQDAITLSLALDVKYIWIDSLCIIQDLSDDWLREASLMSSIYSNSWVNLAATSSRDSTGGLFHKSALAYKCAISTKWTGLAAGTYRVIDDSAWNRPIENAPPNKRGWVLQERLLS